MGAFDPDLQAWDAGADPLAVEPADVAAALPPPLAADARTARLAAAVGDELAALATGSGGLAAVREAAVLPRVGEAGPRALSRAQLDRAAALLGVDFYGPEATDDDVRHVVWGAAAWHARRGTPWSVRWALDAVGAAVAGGVAGDDGTTVDPALLGDANPSGATLELVEPGTARHAALADRLPLPLRGQAAGDDPEAVAAAGGWAVPFVVVDLERVDRAPSGEPGSAGPWGAWVERAVRLSCPAGRRPVWVFYFDPQVTDDALNPTPAEHEGALEVAEFYARLALGRSYEYSTLPTLDGRRALDGTWTLAADAVVARPTDRPAEGAAPPPALYLVATTPGAGPAGADAHELRADRGGLFAVRTVACSFRGQGYDVALARPRPFGLLFAGGALVLRDAETATGVDGSRSLQLTLPPPPSA